MKQTNKIATKNIDQVIYLAVASSEGLHESTHYTQSDDYVEVENTIFINKKDLKSSLLKIVLEALPEKDMDAPKTIEEVYEGDSADFVSGAASLERNNTIDDVRQRIEELMK